MADEQPTIEQIARGVAKALEDPTKWCTDGWAENEYGDELDDALDPAACRWCARGHAWRLFGTEADERLFAAYRMRFNRGDNNDIDTDNDRDDRGREFVRARLLELAASEVA